MKTKRKVDSKAIKQFFIDHTEKIVIGAVGLVFLYFAYGAVTLQVNDSYTQKPLGLKEAAEAAKKTMDRGFTSRTPEKEEPIPPFALTIEKFKEPIALDKYATSIAWKPEIVAPPRPRGTPDVIPVEGLRALAGRGAMGAGGAATNTTGQRWVVLTGLVPYDKQLAEYKRVFQDAGYRGAHDDAPEYIGFLVQRVEIEPGAASAPDWSKATVTCCSSGFLANQVQSHGGATAADVVDQRFLHPSLTSPLPQRAIGEWGDEVAHPSKIKAVALEERNQEAAQAAGGVGATVRPRTLQPPPPAAQGRSPLDDLFQPNAAKKDEAAGKPDDLAMQAPPYYLLRYFDFDVEPGKQYAYRVFATLTNPNWYVEIPDSALLEARQRDQPLLHIKIGKVKQPDEKGRVVDWQADENYWSKPCQSPRLPGDVRVLAGPAESPKPGTSGETTEDIRVLHWDSTTGLNTSAHKAGTLRGESIVVHPTSNERLEADSMLVDIAGGEALGQTHRPSAILVMDEMGSLVMHDEMSEAKEWTDETKKATPKQYPSGGYRRGGYGYGPQPPKVPGYELMPALPAR